MLRNILMLIAAGAALAAGCRAQVPQTPIYSCPAATGAFIPLNQPASNTVAASITGTAYTDSTAASGQWCYVVQSWAIVTPATTYQPSPSSNVVGPIAVPAGDAVSLTWTAPANSAGYSYIVSRAPAVLVPPPTAPTLNAPTV